MYKLLTNIYTTAGCKLSLVIVAHRRLGRKPKSDTQGPIIRVVFSLTFWRQQVSVFFHVYTVVQGRKARNNKNAHRQYLFFGRLTSCITPPHHYEIPDHNLRTIASPPRI